MFMLFIDLAFNPRVDIKAVEPFGFIDLRQALVTNTVPSQLPDSEADYNGIEDPKSILGKPRDVFDAIAMESSINSYVPPTDKDESQ